MEATHETTRSCRHNRSVLAAWIHRSRWSAAAGGETRKARKTNQKSRKNRRKPSPRNKNKNAKLNPKSGKSRPSNRSPSPSNQKSPRGRNQLQPRASSRSRRSRNNRRNRNNQAILPSMNKRSNRASQPSRNSRSKQREIKHNTQHQQQAASSQRPQHTPQEEARQRAQPALRLSERGNGRISDARFHSNFGREHEFHVGTPTLVGGYSRFHYGGYWFGFVEPWPAGWYYTDDVYIDYVDGGYYMYNPYYPDARFALTVVI